MPTFRIFAARDGDTFHETIEAADYDSAEDHARELIAKDFRLPEELASARAEDDSGLFDAELDGFTVEEVENFIPPAALAGAIAILRELANGETTSARMNEIMDEARAILAVIDGEG